MWYEIWYQCVRWHYRGGQHAGDGVYDRIRWSFVRYIWGYRKVMRPKVRDLLTEHGGDAQPITLTSRRDAVRFLTDAASSTGQLTHSEWSAPAVRIGEGGGASLSAEPLFDEPAAVAMGPSPRPEPGPV